MRLYLWTDGACRGNPGPMAVGGIAKSYDHARNLKTIFEFSRFVGSGSNNAAEYRALLAGLGACLENSQVRPTEIDCYLDSELVVRQVSGEYDVKAPNLTDYHKEVRSYIARHPHVKIRFHHIPRSQNKEADALANAALIKAVGGKQER